MLTSRTRFETPRCHTRPRPLEQVECQQGDKQQAVEGASRLAASVRIGKDIFNKQMGNKKSDSKIGV